jgi:hypothetical protein
MLATSACAMPPIGSSSAAAKINPKRYEKQQDMISFSSDNIFFKLGDWRISKVNANT